MEKKYLPLGALRVSFDEYEALWLGFLKKLIQWRDGHVTLEQLEEAFISSIAASHK